MPKAVTYEHIEGTCHIPHCRANIRESAVQISVRFNHGKMLEPYSTSDICYTVCTKTTCQIKGLKLAEEELEKAIKKDNAKIKEIIITLYRFDKGDEMADPVMGTCSECRNDIHKRRSINIRARLNYRGSSVPGRTVFINHPICLKKDCKVRGMTSVHGMINRILIEHDPIEIEIRFKQRDH